MWLHDAIFEVDLKVNKALHRAKRAIMISDNSDLIEEANINAAGQTAIRADVLSERVFLKTLINEGLSGVLYSEECGVEKFGNPSEGDSNSIILLLDPLDGSQNYMKGLQFGCISVAYGEYKPDPVLSDLTRSAIVNLYSDEVYFALKGEGAYYNGKKIPHVNELNLRPFGERPIQISYYAYGAEASRYYFDFQDIYSLRSMGSAAWELALVAENRNDAFVDIRGVLKTHDFAGAKLVVEEVGGKLIFPGKSEKEIAQLPINDFRSGYSLIASIDHALLKFLLEDFKQHGLLDYTWEN